MQVMLRRIAVAVVLLVAASCSYESSSAPVPPLPATPKPPLLTGPSRTFAFESELGYPVSNGTKGSIYVLFDDGRFALRPSDTYEYRGRYLVLDDGVVLFSWEGWSSAGDWGSTGTLKDGLLTVQYNDIMQMTDFEDAVYKLKR